MHKSRLPIILVLGIALLAAVAVEAEWIHRADSFFIAEEGDRQHPDELVRNIILPDDMPGAETETEATGSAKGKSFVCVGYASNSEVSNKGRVTSHIDIFRAADMADEEGEEATLTAAEASQSLRSRVQVRNNLAGECVKVKTLLKGDRVRVTADFANFEAFKLRPYAKGLNFVAAVSSQKIDIKDLFFIIEEDETPDDGGSGGDTGGGGGGGGGNGDGGGGNPPPPPPPPSGSEYDASMRVFSTNKAQLVRPAGNNPGKVAIYCERTRTLPSNAKKADPATYGWGNTVVEALQNTVAKTGCQFAAAPAATATQRNRIDRYLGMSSAAGPTAIRRDANGGFHAEMYRSYLGTSLHQAVPSAVAAIDWICHSSRGRC